MDKQTKEWKLLNALNRRIVYLEQRIERLERLVAEEHGVIRLL